MDIVLPEDPATPLLGIYPEDVPTNKKETCSTMFIADITVSCETMPGPSNHRSGCSQSAIGWIKGPPMEELEKVSKELKRSATLSKEQHYELTSTPELLTLAAYVSKNGLVGHQWKERPIGQANFICPSTGECQGQKMGMGG